MRRMGRGAGAAGAIVLALGLGCNDDSNGPDLETEFEATLTGAAERPNPVTTTATGTATVTINDAAQTIVFTVNVTGLVSATAAHIHTGSTSEAGPIAVALPFTPPAAGTSFTGVLATGTLTAAAIEAGGDETFSTLVSKIRAGNGYINVHTVANVDGEIRGHLVPET